MLHNIDREIDEKAEAWRDMVTHEICNLIILLRRRNPETKIRRPIVYPVVDEAEAFINNHFKESISIQKLSKNFNISPSRLSHLFKKAKGWGIMQYVRDCKLAEAKMLLERDPWLRLKFIAESAGFPDYQIFHRHFKKLIGCTPSNYRLFQTRTPKSSVGAAP